MLHKSIQVFAIISSLFLLLSTTVSCNGTLEQCDKEILKVIPFEGQTGTRIDIPNKLFVIYSIQVEDTQVYYSCSYFNEENNPSIHALPKGQVTKLVLTTETPVNKE